MGTLSRRNFLYGIAGFVGSVLALGDVSFSAQTDDNTRPGLAVPNLVFDDSILNPDDPVAYTQGINDRLIALSALGGGRLIITSGIKKLRAPLRDRDAIYPGYVANNENRRANKAILIYNMSNITIDFDQGAVWDRSEDLIDDESYSQYSCALYISRSRGIIINNYNGVGYQDDGALLRDRKTSTSGDHIQINNDCDGIYINNPVMLDGTTHISVGMSRTASASQLDPIVPACRNVFINNFEGRNGEHDIILFKVVGAFINGLTSRIWQRSDGTTGVKQRGLYLHSCINVHANRLDFDGVFKTSILISNYASVRDVFIDQLTIKGMMTPVDMLARDGSFNPLYFGHGLSIQSDNCENINVTRFRIMGVSIGVSVPGIGHLAIELADGSIDAVYAPFITLAEWIRGAAKLNNPAFGLVLRNVDIIQHEDKRHYGNIEPTAGLLIQSNAVNDSGNIIPFGGLTLESVTVRARNRNARIIDCSGKILNCNFTQSLGLANARNYDFIFKGDLQLSGNTFGNDGRPNAGQNSFSP